MTRGAWTPTFSFQAAEPRNEARPKRYLKPHQNDLVFGFLFRFCSGVVATFAAALPVLLIASLNGWQTSISLLVFYGLQIFILVLIGEHFRSRIFERILNRKSIIESGEEVHSFGFSNVPSPQTLSVRTVRLIRLVKRVIDIIVSSLALCVLFPVMTLVAVAIKMDSRGPVFILRRYNNVSSTFVAITFRTGFVSTKQVRGQTYSFTRAGRFLRMSSLDELPLLFSVLKGDMSLIGPPARVFAQPKFVTALQKSGLYAKTIIKPGLISYTYATHQRVLEADRVAAFELAYASRWSLLRDLRTIIIGAYRVLIGTSSV